jgi:hypothetical protein
MRLARTSKGLISQFPKTALAVATSGAVVISVMILLVVGIGAAPGEGAQANQALATQADPLAGVSSKTRSYVERIASMSNEELVATFGTETNDAVADLAGSPAAREAAVGTAAGRAAAAPGASVYHAYNIFALRE